MILITNLSVCDSIFDAIVIDMSCMSLFKNTITPHYYAN